jgi:hypothetical protein
MKRVRTDAFCQLYNSLIERVHHSPDGFDGLSEAEKLYFALALFRNEVNNGGFQQYFFNSSGYYYEHAEKGLATLGAVQTLELLRKAKVSRDIRSPGYEARRNLIPIAQPGSEWERKLEELDKAFYADSEGLTQRLKGFAREQGLVSAR